MTNFEVTPYGGSLYSLTLHCLLRNRLLTAVCISTTRGQKSLPPFVLETKKMTSRVHNQGLGRSWNTTRAAEEQEHYQGPERNWYVLSGNT
ncbi:hypothetical protein DPEC_G00172590 [Dallia pectoralis]|uniref:Uncharacterized protein n=1 Tax=Dallia pectoralis TaxID=75939 RepID=A0ACC2GDJ6_DALPE|nr:hypothetical protein DPEC_G00172590 [Dallia pectoralis]